MKVRLIIKRTYQPPIDSPASIKWATLEVENDELYRLIKGVEKGDEQYFTSEVVGAEAVEAL